MAKVAFIGVGEAATAIVSGWGDRTGLAGYDIKDDDAMRARFGRFGIARATSEAEAVAEADAVFSTVTADQAVIVAKSAAPHLAAGAFWFDLNSCAPASKVRAASVIEAAGGRYVDVAVMAPVYPKLNMVPLLISGPDADAAEVYLSELPMAPRVVPGEVGRASSIKMIRSVMVKGMEALTAECTMAAIAAGVADEVLPSLLNGHPKLDVAARAAYNFERALQHGERRAAEMDEVAVTLADLGLPNGMTLAAADWERAIGRSGVEMPSDGSDARYEDFAEPLVAAMQRK